MKHFIKFESLRLQVIGLASLIMVFTATSLSAQESDPLADLWNSTEFKKKFLRSYGVASEIEPKFKTPEEQAFYAGLRGIIFDNPVQAIQMLDAEINPQSSATLDFTLGALHFQEGSTSKAIENYQKAIEKFPDFRRAHRNLGIVLSQEGDYAKAIKSLTKTINLGDADPLVYGLLGASYAGVNQHLAAESSFRMAIISEPDSIDWQLGLVRSYLAQEKFTDARKLLDSLLEGNPDSEKLWALQANVLVQQEKLEEALVNLELLRDQGKATSKLLFLLGDLYLNDEFEELALSAYKEALQDPGTASYARILRAAKSFVSMGSYEAATDLLNTVKSAQTTSLSPEEELDILKLEARMAIANEDGEKAIALLTQILEKDPLDGEALIMAGDYYMADGETEKAMFRFESASKVTGFEADGLVKQAQIHVQKSNYKEALTLLRKAQQINPRDNIQRYLENIERLARAASS